MRNDNAATKADRPFVGFTNDIVFREVIRRAPSLGKELLERLLGFQIERMEMVIPQYAVDAGLSSKGVRFDLYAKGSDKAIDCEMQAAEEPYLGKRMRYYQGALDASVLEKGTTYKDLPESYVVFLCRYDPFGRGISRYTIEPACEEAEIGLGSDMRWLVYNASASENEEDEALRNLLRYVEDGTETAGDPLVEEIAEQVAAVNQDDEVMAMIFTMQDEIDIQAAWAYEKGEAAGEARLSDLIRKLLSAGRSEDIERVASDDAYRQKLFKEFGIA